MPFAKSGRRNPSHSSTAKPYDTASLERQVENARIRAADAGFEPDPDKRNWFEKWANLPKGQNGFLDALEIIGRPGQAVLNVIDKAPTGDRGIGEAAWRGFSGKDRVRGSEIVGDRGIDNPIAKAVLGTGLEIVTDPLNLVPAGTVGKGISLAAKPIRGFAGKAYNALEEAAPVVRNFRENKLEPFADDVKRGFSKVFKYQGNWDETLDGTKSDELKNLYNDTMNKTNYDIEESTRRVVGDARVTGLDAGTDIGRIMEKDLRITKDPNELVGDILKGRQVRANIPDGDLSELVGNLNKRILNSSVVQERLSRKTNQLREVGKQIEKLNDKYDLPDIQRRYDAGDVVEQAEEKALERLQKYQQATQRLERDITTTKQGITINPLETTSQMTKGEGFEVVNPLPRVYKKAAGHRAKLMDDLAPKGSFEKVVKPELQEKLKPVVEKLLQTGRVVTENLKGTPEAAELKRVFGKDIQILSKKKSTITLRQNDPNKQYFRLAGANPVIPENLTNPLKRAPEEGLRFEDIQLTDRNRPVNIDRPVREYSDSPIFNVVAKRLMDSNDDIRQTAQASGITVPEIEGYMKHILTQKAREAKRVKGSKGSYGLGQPNKSVIKSRKYEGSAEDVNELLDAEVFNPNAYFATAIGQKQLIEYVQAESFKRAVLNNPKFAVPYKKGMTVDKGQVVINPDQYKFYKVSTPEGNEFLGITKGQEYLVTEGVKEALDRMNRAFTDEGIKQFFKWIDKFQGLWKKLALFSIPFHIRNDIGAKFNMYVSGMNPIDVGKYTALGYETVAKEILKDRGGKNLWVDPLFEEYRKQGLSSSNLSKVEFSSYTDPEKQIEDIVKDRSRTLGQQINARINPLSLNPKQGFINWEAVKNSFETSREAGDFIDQSHRFGLFKWSIEKKGMTPEQAAAKVREVLFDYTRTTNTEREVFARLFPFYRWSRNNIPFQIRMFIRDPAKYSNINKIRLNAQDSFGVEEENAPEFMKEQFAVPVSDKKFLALGLPLGDLTKVASPLKLGADSLTPLIKTPIELATNFNTFFRKPIEKFDGQTKQYQLGGLKGELPIKTAYALEQLTGQIGRGFSQYLTKPEDVDQDSKFRAPKLGIGSILKDYDPEMARYYEKVQELQAYQDYLKWIEQQTGTKPRSVREIR